MTQPEDKHQLINDLNKALLEMQNNQNSQPKRHNRFLYYLGLLTIPFLIAIVIILQEEGNCTKDIRLWLKVLAYGLAVVGLLSLAEILLGALSKVGQGAFYIILLLSLFQLAWYIIGSIWLFGDDTCESQWYSGYVMTLVLLIFFYIQVGLALLCISCLFICAGITVGF